MAPAFILVSLLLQIAAAQPLTIGDTFTIESKVLHETRRVNVYRPSPYGLAPDAPLPVIYMPDGGIQEDFLHVAGLVQVSAGNGTMRPFLLVGIENTDRRRDMTTGSTAFRAFIRTELMPAITARYRTLDETAIVGESLAGLLVVDTLVAEPDLFDTYIAFDPSLWWNNSALVAAVNGMKGSTNAKRLYLATSRDGDRDDATATFAGQLKLHAPPGIQWQYHQLPDETHATVYHAAALKAFRSLFGQR